MSDLQKILNEDYAITPLKKKPEIKSEETALEKFIRFAPDLMKGTDFDIFFIRQCFEDIDKEESYKFKRDKDAAYVIGRNGNVYFSTKWIG